MNKLLLGLLGTFLVLNAYCQQPTISLKLTDVPIKAALDSVSRQSGYTYWFDAADLDVKQRVTVHVTKKSVSEALSLILKGRGVAFQITNGNHIVIYKALREKSPKTTAPEPKKSERVSGRVVDESGNPLIGVTVVIEGEPTSGVSTDLDGRFSILANPEQNLMFSYVGYAPQTVAVGSRTDFEIRMQELAVQIAEAVVVGYGYQKKESVVGAISSIRASDLVQTPVANISNALNGRLPGLTAMQRSGEPGRDEADIFIRGKSTLDDMSAKPLCLVDGVERNFSQIDPNEIETITILKDASATAVYGVRGANGVIIVTTKRGQEGKVQIDFSAQAGFLSPTTTPLFIDGFTQAMMEQAGYYNDNKDAQGNGLYKYTNNQLAAIKRVVVGTATPMEKLLYPNNNWYGETTWNNAVQQQYNINVSGGGKYVKYFISGGYFNQGSFFKDFSSQYYVGHKTYDSQFKFNRYNFRSNIDIDVTKNFRVSVNLAGRLEDINSPRMSANEIFGWLSWIGSLKSPIYFPGKGFADLGGMDNPVGTLTQGGFSNEKISTIESSIILRYDLSRWVKGLSIRGNASFDSRFNYKVSYFEQYPTYSLDWNSQVSPCILPESSMIRWGIPTTAITIRTRPISRVVLSMPAVSASTK